MLNATCTRPERLLENEFWVLDAGIFHIFNEGVVEIRSELISILHCIFGRSKTPTCNLIYKTQPMPVAASETPIAFIHARTILENAALQPNALNVMLGILIKWL